ncbi:MAG: type II toxin-antitoxin system RelE/ParE family toxin [Rhodospirillaceae bacterium]|nr:type II toxin-antitoxin system RelE/ParE family toxin [Rhodospirillaceae bacterium]
MIKSFADKKTEELFNRFHVKGLPSDVQRPALRKLIQIHQAHTLKDLMVPPGNHLETLKGDRQNQHSIRINNQWRICFHWNESDAFDVEIVDYH